MSPDGERARLAAACVGPAAVVRLLAACLLLASSRLRHGRSVPAPRTEPRIVVLETAGWRSPPLLLAASFRQRIRGLRSPAVEGLLIWTRSVHAAGLRDVVTLVRLDPMGRVVATQTLRPGRFVVYRRAGWAVETRGRGAVPPLGAVVTARPKLGGCLAG